MTYFQRQILMLLFYLHAGVAKLVDAHALGACQATGGGSSPLPGTQIVFHISRFL